MQKKAQRPAAARTSRANTKSPVTKRKVAARPPDPAQVTIGVIGSGLMGSSIAACLLAAGHPVIAMSMTASRRRTARQRIGALLREVEAEGALAQPARELMQNLTVSGDYADLEPCKLVIESIIEDLAAKQDVLRQVEAVVSADCIIGSNTSALPISLLQEGMAHPERILGMHWALPAPFSQFMEIIRGDATRPTYANRLMDLTRMWGKDPNLLSDRRGFIANRVGYAMLRECFAIVAAGYATPEEVDRSLRHTIGTWIPFAGPFRYMDMTGIPAYYAVMKDLAPELDNSPEAPELLRRVAESGGRGTQNGRGFFNYSEQEAERWEKGFSIWLREITALARSYPPEVVVAGKLPRRRVLGAAGTPRKWAPKKPGAKS